MICKACSIKKQASYFTLKQVLSKAGLHVEHPVFHSTTARSAAEILKAGFKARAGGPGNDAYRDNSICFTRNLCFSEEDRFGSGQVIFVLDLHKLKTRYKNYSYDWNSVANKPNKYHKYEKNPAQFEYEERISRSPKDVMDVNEPETVIPPKYIELVIIKKSVPDVNISDIWDMCNGKKTIVLREGVNKYSLVKDKPHLVGLFAAVIESDYNSVVTLLNDGESPNGIVGQSPLHYAVDYNMPDIALLLLNHGADPDNKGKAWDVSILETAIDKSIWDNSRVHMVDLLLEHGAEYQSLLTIFVKNERENALELLLERLGTRPYKTDDLVFWAAYKGYAGILKILVYQYDAPYTPDALAEASSFGHIDSVRIMLQSWDDIPQIELNRALYRADQDGHEDVADLVASYGADRSVLETKAPSPVV